MLIRLWERGFGRPVVIETLLDVVAHAVLHPLGNPPLAERTHCWVVFSHGITCDKDGCHKWGLLHPPSELLGHLFTSVIKWVVSKFPV